MSSHLMFHWEEEEAEGFLWDPSVTPLDWSTSTTTANSSNSSVDCAAEQEQEEMPMWTNGPSTLSQWSAFHEDTVLFGDYDHSPLGGHEQGEREEQEQEEEEVLSDSCLNSGRLQVDTGADCAKEDDEGDNLWDILEEQVHFFEPPQAAGEDPSKEAVKMDWPAAVKEEQMEGETPAAAIKVENDAEEEEEALALPRLVLKLETGGFANNCSVVSTPDVVNDVIMLEDEGLFRVQQENLDNLIKIEDSSLGGDIEIVYDEADESEYVEAYVDESDLGFCASPPSVATTTTLLGNGSNANTEAEDDGDEDYEPPVGRQRTRQATRKCAESFGATGSVKKRGRPAKPLRTHLTSRELAHLEPQEKLDFQMRFKNNEASRLSRFKRRQKDLELNQICEAYERENQQLRRVLKEHKRLHKAFWWRMVRIKIPE